MQKLHPLQEPNSVEELVKVLLDVLQCHRWPYGKPRILHRDTISSNMFSRDESNALHGVLTLDSSSTVDETRKASSRQRIGVRPYMAYDLLKPPWSRGYMYRHDLESLFYAVLCIACRYKTPNKLLSDPPYQL